MILIATGTRADWGLLRPLASELTARGHEITVGATNMHGDPEFGQSLEEIRHDGFDPVLIAPCHPDPTLTVAENTRLFGQWIRSRKPSCVVILGDRFEMLGVASAALMERTPIVHIAGGTVSEGAVDDSIRNAISQMASLHLAETPQCARRLWQMGMPADRVVVTGALGVWNSTHLPLMSKEELEADLGIGFGYPLLLGTLHAATRGERPPLESMQEFCAALSSWIGENPGSTVILTWPNNDVDPLPQVAVMEELARRFPTNVKVTRNLGALRYLSLAKISQAVVGNSSSGIVETPSFGTPTLDILPRQKGREHGDRVFHCADDSGSILEGLRQVCSAGVQEAADGDNPYYQADTPAVIADAIETLVGPCKVSSERPLTLYLIPARGGSKGIPGKNIKPFCGKPLICHSIDHARDCGASDSDICVSTDSEEIAATARGYGLDVPFIRPASLATDRSGSYEVIMHALDWYEAHGRRYDRVVLLQPTSPLRKAEDILKSEALWRPDCDMVVSVTEARTNPYYNAFETDRDGCLHISKGNGTYTRRQDAPEVLEYNGAVYVMSVCSLRRGPMSGFTRRIPYKMEASRSVDLDTPLDWAVAEGLYRENS